MAINHEYAKTLARQAYEFDRRNDAANRDRVMHELKEHIFFYPEQKNPSTKEFRGEWVTVAYKTPRGWTPNFSNAVEKWAKAEDD